MSPVEPTLMHVMTVPQSLIFLRGQAKFMRLHGFRIHAVTSPGPDLTSFGQEEGVVTHAISMTRRITPIKDLLSLLHLVRLIRDVRPDIVHSHTPKAGLLGMIAAYLCRVPVRIYHLRGLRAETESGVRRVVLLLAEKTACLLANRVICVGHSLREKVIAQRICPPDKVKVLLSGSGNGVDAARRFNPDRFRGARAEVRSKLGIPDSANVIGFVGRIVRDKGITELAEAWLKLKEEFPDLHLLLVGEPEAVDPVPVEVLERLQGDARVHFVGRTKDVAHYYAAMDILVLPTYREGFPNVILEASAMELPVVSTNVTGSVDAVVNGVTGILVPPRDSTALASAIGEYLRNPEAARSHGKAGRERVATYYHPEAIWKALLGEYADLLRVYSR